MDKVILTGAFGSYLNKEAAMTIGLFPDCDLENVSSIENLAREGARVALLNEEKRKEANEIAKKLNILNVQ